jgi:hypothetical protein
VHLSLAYRSGELIAAINGKRSLRLEDIRGDFSNWKETYIAIGNLLYEHGGWHGRIEGVAIYNRFLEEAEMQRNVRSFEQINGSRP